MVTGAAAPEAELARIEDALGKAENDPVSFMAQMKNLERLSNKWIRTSKYIKVMGMQGDPQQVQLNVLGWQGRTKQRKFRRERERYFNRLVEQRLSNDPNAALESAEAEVWEEMRLEGWGGN